MSSSVPNSDFTNQLEVLLRSFVKEKLELIMREELTNFLQVEQPNSSNSRNGYYQRSLDTRYGKIENLTVPRDREGAFHTALFAPYQRRDGWLEEAVIKMYQSGMSTREVGKFIERIVGSWIERANKEIRKRLKPMNSLSNLKAAEKIVYLTLQDLQECWSTRKLKGFASAYTALQDKFKQKYGE